MPCESSAKCLATFPPDVSAFAMPAIRRFCTDISIESVQRRQSTGDNFVNKICIVAKIRNFIIGLVSIIYIIYGYVIFKALGQPGNYSIKKSRRYESLTRWQYRLFFFCMKNFVSDSNLSKWDSLEEDRLDRYICIRLKQINDFWLAGSKDVNKAAELIGSSKVWFLHLRNKRMLMESVKRSVASGISVWRNVPSTR